ncbi:MAG: type II toxin-antitoxin system RelE/ParE family toxin [Candidatus Omnitrophica bacterium]|nr:type II toxin-antitoxin system RelE/ParE family toxin [Candidatus Omnitrophota bacterium]
MSLNNFTILIDPPASKELKKLHKTQSTLIHLLIKDIDNLASQPYSGKPLKGDKKGCYSLRHGEYRIIYEIYASQKIVHIIRVGHRREIYR